MQIKIFTIPAIGGEGIVDEMNKFLRANKVLETRSEPMSSHEGIYWSFCIKYLGKQDNFVPGTPKKDYRQLLSEEVFIVFSRLREIRKSLAADDGVPAYAVFTDEELSKIAALSPISEMEVIKIQGIGEKKMERYGKKMIQLYLNYEKER